MRRNLSSYESCGDDNWPDFIAVTRNRYPDSFVVMAQSVSKVIDESESGLHGLYAEKKTEASKEQIKWPPLK